MADDIPAVVHDSFRIEQSYGADRSRVFAAFADPATKRRWFVEGEGWQVDEYTADFRVGGRELSRFRLGDGPEIANDTIYLDIVPDTRIVFAYSMTSAGQCISASLTTVELAAEGAGAKLTLTEQSAFFEGGDPQSRKGGWRALLGRLRAELSRAP